MYDLTCDSLRYEYEIYSLGYRFNIILGDEGMRGCKVVFNRWDGVVEAKRGDPKRTDA